MDFQFWCLPRPLLRERRTYSQHGFETDTAVQQTYIVEITSLQPKKIHSHTKNRVFSMFFHWRSYQRDTVDERNPAPAEMVNIPLFSGFYTSEVVQDFWTINGSVVWKKIQAGFHSAFQAKAGRPDCKALPISEALCWCLRGFTKENQERFWSYPPVNEPGNGNAPFPIGNTSSNRGLCVAMLVYQKG